MKRSISAAVLSGALVLLAGGCPGPLLPFLPPPTPGPGGDKSAPRLQPFGSQQELVDYYKNQVNRSGHFDFLRFLNEPAAFDTANENAGGDDSGDFSTTNLQEAGVDESDVFKSDGRHLYIAQRDHLRIVDTQGDELRLVGSLDVDRHIDSMYLRGDKLILLSQDYGFNIAAVDALIFPPFYPQASLRVIEVDISDRANPEIAGDVEFEGSMATSRLIDDRLILVLTIRPEVQPANAIELAFIDIGQIMPTMRVNGTTTAIAPWDRWLRPESPDGFDMTAVVTLDADNVENMLDSVAVMAGAGTVYASTEAIYVTDTNADPDDNYRQRTAIHKFAFDDDGVAQYVASGSIPGRLLNQFSLSEKDGMLRVATHINDIAIIFEDLVDLPLVDFDVATDSNRTQSREPSGPTNAVFVLDEVDSNLDIIGGVENIAPNELIYAARFVGDRGYLVTFRRIDPLFVIDFADPNAPEILGELKIPGFSDYLHPLGETHLIGVGRTTEETPWGGVIPAGVQLSLFDVSDPHNPTAVQQIDLGDGWSDINGTHKAFTMIERDDENLVMVPAVLPGHPNGPFEGVLAFDVQPATGFAEKGRIAATSTSFWNQWRRAAIIDDAAFALTDGGVHAVNLPDFSDIDELMFEAVPFDFGRFGEDVDVGGDASEPNVGQ